MSHITQTTTQGDPSQLYPSTEEGKPSGVGLSPQESSSWFTDTSKKVETLNISTMVEESGQVLDAAKPHPPKPTVQAEGAQIQPQLIPVEPRDYELIPLSNLLAEEQQIAIGNLGKQKNLSKQQIDLIRFYNDHPDMVASADSVIVEYLNLTNEEALAKLKKKYPDSLPKDGKPKSTPFTPEKALSQHYSKEFERLVESRTDLTADQKIALRYGFYHPEHTPVSVQQELETFQAKALRQTQETYGETPEGWSPSVDSLAIDDELAFAYAQRYEQALLDYRPPLTPRQITIARLLNFYPSIFDDYSQQEKVERSIPILTAINKQINQQILAEFKTQQGLPPNWQPPPICQRSYQAQLVGDYLYEISKQVDEWAQKPIHPVTGEPIAKLPERQIALIKYAIVRPDATFIPAYLKEIAAHLSAEILPQIQQKYTLPDKWKPPTHLVNPMLYASAEIQRLTRATQNLEDDIEIIQSHARQAPDSPEKSQFIDHLKTIVQALALMKQSLFEMLADDSAKAKDFTKAELEAKLFKIEEEKRLREEQQKQAKKAKSPFRIFLRIITAVVVTLATAYMAWNIAAFIGPMIASATGGGAVASTAISVAYVSAVVGATITLQIDRIIRGEDSAINKMLKSMENMGMKPGWAKFLTVLTFTVALTPMMGIDVMTQEANFLVETFVGLFTLMGASELAGEIFAMVFTIIIAFIFTYGASRFISSKLQPSKAALEKAKAALPPSPQPQNLTERMGLIKKATKDWISHQDKVMQAQQKVTKATDNTKKALAQLAQYQRSGAPNPQQLGRLQQAAQTAQQQQQVARSALEQAQALQAVIRQRWLDSIGGPTLMQGLEIAQSVAIGVGGIAEGYISGVKAKQAKTIGEFEAFIKELEALISAMQKVIHKMYEDLSNDSSFTKWATDVQQQLDTLWGGISQATTKVHHAIV